MGRKSPQNVKALKTYINNNNDVEWLLPSCLLAIAASAYSIYDVT